MTKQGPARIRVLYIAGAGRSGGTIISHVLGQQTGYFYAGELRDLWREGVLDGALCGCGRPVRDCPVWHRILERLAPSAMQDDYRAQMTSFRAGFTRLRSLPRVLIHLLSGGESRELHEYTKRLERLYHFIGEVSDCQVIVDASRSLPYVLLLSAIPSLEVHIVQLVRDPRSVAFSWQRKRTAVMERRVVDLPTRGVVASSLDWIFQNALAEMLLSRVAHSWRLARYEDIMRDPARWLGDLIQAISNSPPSFSIKNGTAVALRPNHSVAGNTYRTQTGLVELTEDNKWKDELPRRDKWLVSILTWPWLLHHRYSLSS